jgi:relaxase-like protein
MTKRVIRLPGGERFLDIGSYGRWGPGHSTGFSRGEIEQIARTVGRTPEVVVKVLPKRSNDAGSIRKHINYIGRSGDLEVEMDDGTELKGKNAGKKLLDDWDLDLETDRRESEFAKTRGRPPSKLVHKLTFSMPPGTSPKGVLIAARNFAREEFGLKHRYALVLHTDEPHPHVHMVVKAVSEQGHRLNIRKETLREWRQEFARHLREQGIAANATYRAVRGQSRTHKTDGIYRAILRGESKHTRARVESVASDLVRGSTHIEAAKEKLTQTRREVERGWCAVREILITQGHHELAAQVKQFVDHMPPPRTERELIAARLSEHTKERQVQRAPRTR